MGKVEEEASQEEEAGLVTVADCSGTLSRMQNID